MSTFFNLQTEFSGDRLSTTDFPRDSLECLFLMDKPISNNTLIDESGNGNNGTISGATKNSTGLNFNQSHVDTSVLLSSAHTIFIVFKTDSIPDGENRFIAGNFSQSSDFYVRGTTNQFNGRIDIGNSSLLRGNIDKSRVENNWVFAALSSSDNYQRLIIPQAGLYYEDTIAPDGAIGSTTNTFTLGWDSGETASVPQFSGDFGLVGVYSKILSTREICGVYNLCKGIMSQRGVDLGSVL